MIIKKLLVVSMLLFPASQSFSSTKSFKQSNTNLEINNNISNVSFSQLKTNTETKTSLYSDDFSKDTNSRKRRAAGPWGVIKFSIGCASNTSTCETIMDNAFSAMGGTGKKAGSTNPGQKLKDKLNNFKKNVINLIKKKAREAGAKL